MKLIQIFAMVVFIAGTINLQAQDMHPAYAALEGAGQAYDAQDAELFASHFTEDAILTSPMGNVIVSKEGIYQAHKAFFENVPANPEDATAQWYPRGHQELTDDLVYGVVANGEEAGSLTFSVLLEKQEAGNWLIKAVQMTPIVPFQQEEGTN